MNGVTNDNYCLHIELNVRILIRIDGLRRLGKCIQIVHINFQRVNSTRFRLRNTFFLQSTIHYEHLTRQFELPSAERMRRREPRALNTVGTSYERKHWNWKDYIFICFPIIYEHVSRTFKRTRFSSLRSLRSRHVACLMRRSAKIYWKSILWAVAIGWNRKKITPGIANGKQSVQNANGAMVGCDFLKINWSMRKMAILQY